MARSPRAAATFNSLVFRRSRCTLRPRSRSRCHARAHYLLCASQKNFGYTPEGSGLAAFVSQCAEAALSPNEVANTHGVIGAAELNPSAETKHFVESHNICGILAVLVARDIAIPTYEIDRKCNQTTRLGSVV